MLFSYFGPSVGIISIYMLGTIGERRNRVNTMCDHASHEVPRRHPEATKMISFPGLHLCGECCDDVFRRMEILYFWTVLNECSEGGKVTKLHGETSLT